jgi:hypothetical protein
MSAGEPTDRRWPTAIACFLIVVVLVNLGFATVAARTAPEIEAAYLLDQGR